MTRSGPTVLSLGGDPHYCLGAPLARLEAAVFVTELVRWFPRIRAAWEAQRAGTVFQGFRYLPVALS
ncbi:MAG TPA: hypothetical protein VGG25_14070 [Streptosporangiaceae bacterium]|jgi:hypothetical protein